MQRIPQEFNRVVTNSIALSKNRNYRANDVWKAIKDIEALKVQPYVKDIGSVQSELNRALGMYYKATKIINDGSIRNYDQEKSSFDIAANAMEKALDDYLDKAQVSEVGIKIEPNWHEDELDRDLKKIITLSPYDAPDPRFDGGRYRGGQATPAERPAENGYGWELWMTFDDDPDTIYIIGREKDSFNSYEDAVSFVQRYYPSFGVELDKDAFSERLFNKTDSTPQREGKNPRAIYRSYSMKAVSISPPSEKLFYEKNFVVNYDRDIDELLEALRRGAIRLSVMFRKTDDSINGLGIVRKQLGQWMDSYLEINSYYPKMPPTVKQATIQLRKMKQKVDGWADGPWIPEKLLTESTAKEWSDFWLKAVERIERVQDVVDEYKAEKAEMIRTAKNVVQVISAPASSQYPSPSEAIYTTKVDSEQFKSYRALKSAIVGALKDSATTLFKLAVSDHVITDVRPILDNLNRVIALKESMLTDASYFSSTADKDRFERQVEFARDLESDLESSYAELGYVSDDLHRMLESFAEDEVDQSKRIIQSDATKFYILGSIAGWFRNVIGTIVGTVRVFTKVFGDIFKKLLELLYKKGVIFVWQLQEVIYPLYDRLQETLKDYRKSISHLRNSKRLEEIGNQIDLSSRRTKVALSELQKLGKDRVVSSSVFKEVVSLLLPDIARGDNLKKALEEAAAGEVSRKGNVPLSEADEFVQTGNIPDSVMKDIESAFEKAGVQVDAGRIRDIDMLFHDMDMPDEEEIKNLYREWNNFEKLEVPNVPNEEKPTINEGVIDKMFEQKKRYIRQTILHVLLSDTNYNLILSFIQDHPSSDIAKKFESLMADAQRRYEGTMDAEPALAVLIAKNQGNTNVQYFQSILNDAKQKYGDEELLKRGQYVYDMMMKFNEESSKPRDSQSDDFKKVFANVSSGTGKPSDSGEERARYYASQYNRFLSEGYSDSDVAITDEVIRYLAQNFISNLSDDDWKYLVAWIDDKNLLDFSNL